MKKYTLLLLISIFLSCNKEFEYSTQDNEELALELWKHVDENYSFFTLKQINWDSVKTEVLSKVRNTSSRVELFGICIDMLLNLRDRHVSLQSNDRFERYDLTEGFEVHFDLELVRRKYLKTGFQRAINYSYGIIQDTIGYAHLSGFTDNRNFEQVFSYFTTKNVGKIILDVRDNTGGDLFHAQNIIEHLIKEPRTIGYQRFKTGTGHDEFSELLEIRAEPEEASRIIKTHIITNRASYSAASF